MSRTEHGTTHLFDGVPATDALRTILVVIFWGLVALLYTVFLGWIDDLRTYKHPALSCEEQFVADELKLSTAIGRMLMLCAALFVVVWGLWARFDSVEYVAGLAIPALIYTILTVGRYRDTSGPYD